MFGMINPQTAFKMLAAAGVRIRFDLDKAALIVTTDEGEQEHSFADIEKLVNGEG